MSSPTKCPTRPRIRTRVYARGVSLDAPNRWLAALIVSTLGCLPTEPPGDSVGDSASASASADGTEETGASGLESLIDHQAWTQLDAAGDPLADHRPSIVECGLGGWYLEDETLEIDTNLCNYLALAQPSLAAITEGRTLRIEFYYFNLVAPEPALAHVAVLVDGQLLWEDEIEIPGDAQVVELEIDSPLSAPIGAELVFHLHNHGQNTWVLQGISAEQ